MSIEDINDWNRIADTYAEFANPDDFINQQFKPILWESLGDINELDVLDLGCGAGWLSDQLDKAGAKVTGIDGSLQLLEKARSTYPHIEFVECDLSEGLPPLERLFDRAIANMVLMDIPDLTLLMQSLRAVLKVGSKFIFTMPHPCFFNMKSDRDSTGQLFRRVTGYLKPEVWRIEGFGGHNHYHRSLTYYFELLRTHRLAVTRLYEPKHILRTQKT